MKTITSGLALLCLLTFNSSCKKGENDSTSTQAYPDYAKLKVGNYWVYQQYTVDSNGIAVATTLFDSCYVKSDTVINGQTYYSMYRNDPFTSSAVYFLRDSLNCIVDAKGKIFFMSTDFIVVLEDYYQFTGTPDSIHYVARMDDINAATIVPAGTFITKNYKRTYFSPTGNSTPNPKIMNTKYAENIGIVVETMQTFSNDSLYTERRLVRYHVQ